MSSCATCDGAFFKRRPIAVVGGGDTALEEALFLTRFASKVTVCTAAIGCARRRSCRTRRSRNPKIAFVWNSEVEDITDAGKGEVTGLIAAESS